jgi:hypothetical protein
MRLGAVLEGVAIAAAGVGLIVATRAARSERWTCPCGWGPRSVRSSAVSPPRDSRRGWAVGRGG